MWSAYCKSSYLEARVFIVISIVKLVEKGEDRNSTLDSCTVGKLNDLFILAFGLRNQKSELLSLDPSHEPLYVHTTVLFTPCDKQHLSTLKAFLDLESDHLHGMDLATFLNFSLQMWLFPCLVTVLTFQFLLSSLRLASVHLV